MSKINILDSAVYNQIAAGEVVENPASIIKELVENSIDAGAVNISIMIEEGGIKSICVVDDGEGMIKDDLKKSVLPHSTSKIKTANDLHTISTLGFRGEALSSIASVSRLEIKSKFYDAELAYGLTVEGGKVVEDDVVSLNKGTSISVTKLFYNTPARYKFLKSPKSEENNITSLIADIILSNADIAFRYYVDNKLYYSSAGEGLKNSIESIYEKDIVENLVEIDYAEKPYNIFGYIGKPNTPAIKFNRSFQTLIINGRVVKDYVLSAIVQNAYGQKLMKRTFPIFILDIVMPFDLVDVNVHPNKKDVRLAKNCKIKTVLYNAVKDVLERLEYDEYKDTSFISKPVKETGDSDIVSDNVSLKEYITDNIAKQQPVGRTDSVEKINKKLDYLSKIAPRTSQHITRLKEETEEVLCAEETFEIVGQIFNTYIIIEHNNSMYLVDQHAAHERLIYDEYINKLKNKPLDIQDLLVPYIYQTDANGCQYILQNKQILADMGFVIEEFGNNLIKVLSVPLQFIDINFDDFFADIIQYFIEVRQIEDINLINHAIAKRACKNAIKGGRSLSHTDIRYIIENLFRGGIPLQCPHGRPVTVKLSKIEIEKMFRRIV